eukprot:2711011-Pyramimonas_sp.AAC.1
MHIKWAVLDLLLGGVHRKVQHVAGQNGPLPARLHHLRHTVEHILTMDQSDAVRAGIFPPWTNQIVPHPSGENTVNFLPPRRSSRP